MPETVISTKGSIYAHDPTAHHTGGDFHGAPQIQSVRDDQTQLSLNPFRPVCGWADGCPVFGALENSCNS
jgi:hypothetical protein